MNRTGFAIILALFSGVIFWPVAFADDFRSENFTSRDPVIDDFGGYSSGSQFRQFDAGGQPAIGESYSSNFILRGGFLYFLDFTVRSQNWRWYGDEASETPVSALAAENTAPSGIANQDPLKLRVTIAEIGGIGSESIKYKLQYSRQSDFSSGVADVVEQGTCGATSQWCYYDGAGDDNAVISTATLSDADSCSGGSGSGCGTHNESGVSVSDFTHKLNVSAEFEFTIKPAGPQPNVVYYFRPYDVVNDAPVQLNSGETYPSLTTEGASLSFQVIGVAGGVGTEGETTDVATTSTSISFGTLNVGAETDAAQRLLVTTNAPNGYSVYLFRNGAFQTVQGATIDDVTGTNASPAAFALPAGQHSAFGYHSGDALLSGGSTRFAADDTYAALESTPREIVYNADPVIDEQTDVVYKLLIDALQEAGTYATEIEYIIVPVF